MRLITRIIYKYRNSEIFDHFLYFRCVKDHRRFDCQITISVNKSFIIRFAIFSCKCHLSGFHCFLCTLHIPAGGLKSGEFHLVNSADCIKQRHGCCRRHINILCRLLNHNNILRQVFRFFFSFRNNQILLIFMNVNQLISIFIIVYIEFCRISQIHCRFISESFNLRCFFCLVGCIFSRILRCFCTC